MNRDEPICCQSGVALRVAAQRLSNQIVASPKSWAASSAERPLGKLQGRRFHGSLGCVQRPSNSQRFSSRRTWRDVVNLRCFHGAGSHIEQTVQRYGAFPEFIGQGRKITVSEQSRS